MTAEREAVLGVLLVPIEDAVWGATHLALDVTRDWLAETLRRNTLAHGCARDDAFCHAAFFAWDVHPLTSVPEDWYGEEGPLSCCGVFTLFWGRSTAEVPADSWVTAGHPHVTLHLDGSAMFLWELQYDGPPDERIQTDYVYLPWLRALLRAPVDSV